MTAQVPDLVVAKRVWSLAGVDGGPLLDPAGAGVTPVMTSTACWRGYLCRYQVAGGRFRLAALAPGTRAKIGGRETGPDATLRDRVAVAAADGDRWLPGNGFWFRGLDLPAAFTGRPLPGRGLVESAMVNMGFQPAWEKPDRPGTAPDRRPGDRQARPVSRPGRDPQAAGM